MDKHPLGCLLKMTVLLAFVISTAVLPVIIPILRRSGCVDVPNDRSSHHRPTPRGGGFALVIGGLAAVLAAGDVPLETGWPYAALLAVYGGVGLLDDIRGGINAVARLATCALAATAFVLPAVMVFQGRSLLFGLASAVFVVGFTNSYNFMDGVNGISAIHLVVYGGVLAYLAAQPVGFRASYYVGLALVGCGLAFLPFNAVSPRVFMGDAGTYALGGAASFAGVGLIASGVHPFAVLSVFVPYILDTGFTVVRRARAHERWWEPHREHAYQKLIQLGMSHLAVAVTVGLVSLACGLVGMAVLRLRPSEPFVWFGVAVGLAAAYATIPHALAILLRAQRSAPPGG